MTTERPPIPHTLDLEIFRAGDYGAKGTFTEEQLDALARDYSPQSHEAPVTLDHEQSGPAHGWVKALRRAGDRLIATLERLSPALRDALASGAYRKRSVELYRSFSGTDRPYLKAVSFLGAAAPEVKGLADPAFSENELETVVSFAEDNNAAAAETARRRLVEARRWNPQWEANGLCDVFAALGEGDELDRLVDVLMAAPEPVTFGESPRDDSVPVHDAIDEFVGEPSPESVQRHHEAMAFMATHPTVSYAEALGRTARRKGA